MRKALIVATIILAFVFAALPAFAADKVDNVFIIGLDAGFYGATGWIGENYDAGPGFGLFFGYGITEYFAMEINYTPMIMTSPSGDDVDGLSSAVWGFSSNGGFGGIGIAGRLYPRKAFREADFKVVQPVLSLGVTYMAFIWEYENTTADGNDYDGINNILFDFGVGVDFYITEFISLGPAIGLHMPFIMGDTLQGLTLDELTDDGDPTTEDQDFQSDWESSLMWDASVVLKFQW